MSLEQIQFAAWQAMHFALMRDIPFSSYNAVTRRFLK